MGKAEESTEEITFTLEYFFSHTTGFSQIGKERKSKNLVLGALKTSRYFSHVSKGMRESPKRYRWIKKVKKVTNTIEPLGNE